MQKQEDGKLIKIAVWGILLIIFEWSLSAIIILKIFPANEAHGTFGDLFGAINALFSGLAFLGVIVAILLQKEELKEQRKEIIQSRIAQDKSALALSTQSKISGLMVRLDALNHMLSSLDRQIARARSSGKYDSANKIESLTLRQEKYEASVEKLLNDIELLEEEEVGRH